MAENSKIEWTHHTVNFWWGCEKVSPACTHCYAEALDARYQLGGEKHWGPKAKRYVRWSKALAEVLALNRKAAKRGVIERVFINSMSDTFEDHDDLEEARLELFKAIADCDNLIFQLLTKRPENVRRLVPPWIREWPGNIWLGVTVEDQERADERIPELLKIPARVRFLSCEPLLGLVDLRIKQGCGDCDPCIGGREDLCAVGVIHLFPEIDWVICGGESGPKKRPMSLEWARSLRDQCQAAGVSYFFKQVDKVQPIPADLQIREFPNP